MIFIVPLNHMMVMENVMYQCLIQKMTVMICVILFAKITTANTPRPNSTKRNMVKNTLMMGRCIRYNNVCKRIPYLIKNLYQNGLL